MQPNWDNSEPEELNFFFVSGCFLWSTLQVNDKILLKMKYTLNLENQYKKKHSYKNVNNSLNKNIK